jgi:hypothetical protein
MLMMRETTMSTIAVGRETLFHGSLKAQAACLDLQLALAALEGEKQPKQHSTVTMMLSRRGRSDRKVQRRRIVQQHIILHP